MTKIGYARVSTRDQDPQLQIDALRETGRVDEVVEEKARGSRKGKPAKVSDDGHLELPDRPVLETTLRRLGKGDTLVVWKLDRLGRSAVDLETIVNALSERGVGVHFLTEGLDTTGGGIVTDLVRRILAAVAQFEKELILERVTNGIASAKRNGTRSGKPFGRPSKFSDADLDLLVELWDHGTPVAALAKKWDVDPATIYRAHTRALARTA